MENLELQSVIYTLGSVLVALISGYVGVRVATIKANQKKAEEYVEVKTEINVLSQKIDAQGNKIDEQSKKMDEQNKKIDNQGVKLDDQGKVQNAMQIALGKVETMVNILDRNFTNAKKN